MESENDTCFDQISSHILRAARNTPNWQIAKGLIIEIRETWAIGTIIDYMHRLAIRPWRDISRRFLLTRRNHHVLQRTLMCHMELYRRSRRHKL